MSDTDFIPWSELLPGAINAEEIGEGEIVTYRIATLRNREVAEIGPGRKPTGKKITKAVIGFEGGRFLVVNVCNKNLIGLCFGCETPAWKGKRLNLTAIRTHFFGGCLALRVCGSPDIADDLQTEIDIGPPRKGAPSEWIAWTLRGRDRSAAAPRGSAPWDRPISEVVAAIPRGETRLGGDVLADLRARFGVEGSPDPAAWTEPLARSYLRALVEAVRA